MWDDGSVDEPVAWYLRGELGSVLDLSLHSPSSKTEGGGGSHPTVKKQDLEPTYEWTGIMGYSRDGHPFVGRVPSSLGGGPDDDDADVGLYVCAGYTGHGMPNAVLSAKAAVDMMYGDGDGDGAEVDLPPEYELTEQRVAAARRGDEVAVVDSKGTLYADFGHLL